MSHQFQFIFCVKHAHSYPFMLYSLLSVRWIRHTLPHSLRYFIFTKLCFKTPHLLFHFTHTHTHKPTHTHPFCYSIKSAKSILSGILNMTFATDYWQHRRLIEWHRTKTSISWFFEREKYVSQLFKEFNNFIWEKSALKEIRIKIKTYASMIIRLPP